ncbi:MAG: VanZ family protein [Anaerolineae bacterium]|nr:VanZ family protein [Anaerolineae bacterium]
MTRVRASRPFEEYHEEQTGEEGHPRFGNRSLLRVSLWAPVLLWMAGIFYFSSRPDPLGFLPSSMHSIGIDRLAHIGEYAGLTVLLYRALAGEQQGVRNAKRPAPGHPHTPQPNPPPSRRVLVLSFALALAYAVLDELHQKLVPGRGGGLLDIGWDVAGMAAALGLIWLGRRTGERRGRGAGGQGVRQEQGSRGEGEQGGGGEEERWRASRWNV